MSSNKRSFRRKYIKEQYKKYNDLPTTIIKEIIKYKDENLLQRNSKLKAESCSAIGDKDKVGSLAYFIDRRKAYQNLRDDIHSTLKGDTSDTDTPENIPNNNKENVLTKLATKLEEDVIPKLNFEIKRQIHNAKIELRVKKSIREKTKHSDSLDSLDSSDTNIQ